MMGWLEAQTVGRRFGHLFHYGNYFRSACRSGPATKTVDRHYEALVDEFAGELNVLTSAAVDDLNRISGTRLAQAVSAVREGRVDVEPGYDGVYGTVTPIVE